MTKLVRIRYRQYIPSEKRIIDGPSEISAEYERSDGETEEEFVFNAEDNLKWVLKRNTV